MTHTYECLDTAETVVRASGPICLNRDVTRLDESAKLRHDGWVSLWAQEYLGAHLIPCTCE